MEKEELIVMCRNMERAVIEANKILRGLQLLTSNLITLLNEVEEHLQEGGNK